ncbi:MAG: ATPase [Alphaproteobacteria bacterium]|nr:ATPase [Alphaproteobacteria bacterium]
MTMILGVDGGASSTRWRLEDEAGRLVDEGVAPPLTGHVFTPDSQAAAAATIAAVAAAVVPHGRPDFVVAGVTGLTIDDEAARLIQFIFIEALSLSGDRVAILDDMRIAYLGAFGPGEGILVYAGTGAIAYHLTPDQRIERVGGHGYLIDDAGGGFWIGRQALRALLRRRDEGRTMTTLDQALCLAIGGGDWPTIRAHVYGGGRQAVAALARCVVEVAQRGDVEASSLLMLAGSELGRLAVILQQRVGVIPVAVAGGIARHSPALVDGLRRELGPGSGVRIHRAEPVATAAALARGALSVG